MLVACKKVPGGRWLPSAKCWHYPLSVDTCHALRSAFGDSLRVGANLADWYRSAAAHRAAQATLSGEMDAELSHTPPAFAQWLHGYQRAGAVWIGAGYRRAGLVADKPGVGKTPELIAGLLEGQITGPVLIVCPKASVRMVWAMEIKRHLPTTPVYLCSGTREQRQAEIGRFAADMERDRKSTRLNSS